MLFALKEEVLDLQAVNREAVVGGTAGQASDMAGIQAVARLALDIPE